MCGYLVHVCGCRDNTLMWMRRCDRSCLYHHMCGHISTYVCLRMGSQVVSLLYVLLRVMPYRVFLLFLYLGVSLTFRPMGAMHLRLCIHLDSALSLRCSAAEDCGWQGMKSKT